MSDTKPGQSRNAWDRPITGARQQELRPYLERMRNEQPQPEGNPVLKGHHLTGADVGWLAMNLRNITGDVPNLNLREAILVDAHLEEVHLQGAHLEGTNLARAHLEGAILERAHLEGADIQDAHLQKAHLNDAHFKRTSFCRAHMEGAKSSRSKPRRIQSARRSSGGRQSSRCPISKGQPGRRLP